MSRKLLFTLTAVLVAASGYAKTIDIEETSGSNFGIEAGYSHNWIYTNTSVLLNVGGKIDETNNKATLNLDGFHIGPSYTYFFNSVDGLYVNGGIIYQYGRAANVNKSMLSSLTFDLSWDWDFVEKPLPLKQFHNCDKFSYTAHSLNVPIRIGYNYTFKNGMGFQVFVGPTFNFALDWNITGTKDGSTYTLNQLNGKLYIKNGDNSQTYAENTSERAVYNIFDVSLGGGAGFTYKWVYFNIACDWGLTNICKVASAAGKVSNVGTYSYTNKASQTQLKLSVGFRF